MGNRFAKANGRSSCLDNGRKTVFGVSNFAGPFASPTAMSVPPLSCRRLTKAHIQLVGSAIVVTTAYMLRSPSSDVFHEIRQLSRHGIRAYKYSSPPRRIAHW